MLNQEKLNEIVDKVSNDHNDLNKLKIKFDEAFKFLGQISDIGLNNLDDINKIVNPYKEMVEAGFPDVESINAKIKEVYALCNTTPPVTPPTSSNTNLFTQLVAFLMGMFSHKLVKTNVEPVSPTMEVQILSAMDLFNNYLKGQKE